MTLLSHSYFFDVFYTLDDVSLLLSIFGVIRVNENGRVGVQCKLNHFST